MCQEVYELVLEKGKENLELQMAMQCAPLISGLKPSNLLITGSGNLNSVQEMIQRSGLSQLLLYQDENRLELLLFCEEDLTRYLQEPAVWNFLNWKGYREGTLRGILRRFQKRYGSYKIGASEFPHEFGLLLGYPLEDVYGFMKHQGKNCLYSGYWKVYAKLPCKLRLFQRFALAEQVLAHLLSEGIQMTEVLQNRELVTGRMLSPAFLSGAADC